MPAPPTKTVRFLCLLMGVGMFASLGKRHWGTPGLIAGLLLGAALGWLLGWWVKRTFLDI